MIDQCLLLIASIKIKKFKVLKRLFSIYIVSVAVRPLSLQGGLI